MQTIVDGWITWRRYLVDHRRRDGKRQTLPRETCDRPGDSVAVLMYCRAKGTVILVKQFRLSGFLGTPHRPTLAEIPGGLIGDGESAEAALRREIAEEIGVTASDLTEVFRIALHPPLTREHCHLFIGEYDPGDPLGGGGVEAEGEDIEICEIPLQAALDLVELREICDAKTVLMLYYLRYVHIPLNQP